MLKYMMAMVLGYLIHKHGDQVTKYWNNPEELEKYFEKILNDEKLSALKERFVKAFKQGTDALEAEFKKFLDEMAAKATETPPEEPAPPPAPVVMPTENCPKCGQENAIGSPACSKCGGPVTTVEELKAMLEEIKKIPLKRGRKNPK